MKKFTACLVLLQAVSFLALADWNPGDPYKMHFPQLPDPLGWDVDVQNYTLADDFQCTESGPISSIHFWVSWMSDIEGSQFQNIHLSIHDDVPDPDGAGPEYSHPGVELWNADLNQGDFQMQYQFYGSGDEGWFDPGSGQGIPHDHVNYFQVNCINIADPFGQVAGTIYWLDINIQTDQLIGWKTSQDHFNDDSVYWDELSTSWKELRDPETGESLDQAFVIVPEPNTGVLLLMLASGVGIYFRRRYRT